MTNLRACWSYQLTPGAVYRVFLPDFGRTVDYYVDTTTDVYHAGTSLSRLLFNSSMSLNRLDRSDVAAVSYFDDFVHIHAYYAPVPTGWSIMH